MKKPPACPKKGMKSGVDRDSHSGKNCHHFCCAPARTTYGSPADKYNLFLFFSHFTCTFHLWNIKTSHEVPVNPLAPQHPLSGMCYFPESSRPAVRGVRPTGSVGGQRPSDPSLCPSEKDDSQHFQAELTLC